jgi:HK97 family phage major capsid protein
MTATLETLAARVKAGEDKLDAIHRSVEGVTKKLERTHAGPNASDVFGVPGVRRGEDIMGSRGFSFMKMLGVITGAVSPQDAKIELDVHSRLHGCFADTYDYRGGFRVGEKAFLAPLATSFFAESHVPRDFRREMKGLICAGTDGYDLDEARWIRRKALESQYGGQVGNKTLSWLNELSGGALVPPAEMGELIELLRNKEALVNAGARTVPLPPQGRMKYPKQTSSSLTYWVGENQPIPQSEIGTGEVTLQAKKLAVLIKAPNELLRFASPAAEALMRDDMTKSLALGLDLAALEGMGGDHRPKGVLQHANIQRLASSRPAADGDAIVAEDLYRMVATVEEANAEFEGFIMRPKTLYKFFQLRFDAVSQGDKSGGFLFNLIREAADGLPKATLAGFPVTKSTQISQSRAKGASTNLTYIMGGMWSDVLLGMFGAIEFAATNVGDTAFVNDQTWVRGILSADVAIRHEAAFVLMDNLNTKL